MPPKIPPCSGHDFDVVNSLHDSENPDFEIPDIGLEDCELLDDEFDVQDETNWREFNLPVEE